MGQIVNTSMTSEDLQVGIRHEDTHRAKRLNLPFHGDGSNLHREDTDGSTYRNPQYTAIICGRRDQDAERVGREGSVALTCEAWSEGRHQVPQLAMALPGRPSEPDLLSKNPRVQTDKVPGASYRVFLLNCSSPFSPANLS